MAMSETPQIRAGREDIPWIDVLKGLGITAVVAGHALPPAYARLVQYLFWFHVPLFFVCSGYLFRPTDDFRGYLVKGLRRLAVPYLVYLVLLSLPAYVFYVQSGLAHPSAEHARYVEGVTFRLLYGGRDLTGRFMTFWFVSCLFFSRQVYNWLWNRCARKEGVMAAVVGIGYVAGWFYNRCSFLPALPLGLEVVPLALLFMAWGHWLARQSKSTAWGAWLAAGLIMIAVLLDGLGVVAIHVNLKSGQTGPLMLGVACSISCVYLVILAARSLSRIGWLRPVFADLGRASLVIMFLHPHILFEMGKRPRLCSFWMLLAAGIAIPWAAYRVFIRYSPTTELFLGGRARGRP